MIENTFGINIIPENDSERLVALKRYRIMDTPGLWDWLFAQRKK